MEEFQDLAGHSPQYSFNSDPSHRSGKVKKNKKKCVLD